MSQGAVESQHQRYRERWERCNAVRTVDDTGGDWLSAFDDGTFRWLGLHVPMRCIRGVRVVVKV